MQTLVKQKIVMIKKTTSIFFALIAVFFFMFSPAFALAEENNPELNSDEVLIHFFDDKLCSVCNAQKDFMNELKKDYPQINLKIYPISDTEKLAELAEEHNIKDYRIMSSTTFVNGQFFQFNAFGDKEKDMLIKAIEGEAVEEDDDLIIKIPFLDKEINISNLSLPVIAVVLGSLDGFNVCSIGALILIISIVLVFDSRKKIFIFGGIFILTTAIVYGFLVFAWGRIFNVLVGQLEILRIIVGLAALGGALYFFKEFLRFFRYGPTCQTSDSKIAKKATDKLLKVFKNPKSKLALLVSSIIFFAFVITLVELPCSIGIPIAYTGILAEKGVSILTYTFYVLVYIFFYMLIEIIVFSGAVLTKKIWFAGSKMITWTTFIGALVLFYLALHYLIGL